MVVARAEQQHVSAKREERLWQSELAPRQPSARAPDSLKAASVLNSVDFDLENSDEAAPQHRTAGPQNALTEKWRDLPSRWKVVAATSMAFVICNMVGSTHLPLPFHCIICVRWMRNGTPTHPHLYPTALCMLPCVCIYRWHIGDAGQGQHQCCYHPHGPGLWLESHCVWAGPELLLLRLCAHPDPRRLCHLQDRGQEGAPSRRQPLVCSYGSCSPPGGNNPRCAKSRVWQPQLPGGKSCTLLQSNVHCPRASEMPPKNVSSAAWAYGMATS